MDEMVAHYPGGFIGVGSALATVGEMRNQARQRRGFADESTLAAPVDQIYMTINLTKPWYRIGRRSRTQFRETLEASVRQPLFQAVGHAIPRRNEDRQGVPGEQKAQALAPRGDVGQHFMERPIRPEFGFSFAIRRSIFVTKPMRQDMNAITSAMHCGQFTPGTCRNDGQGERNANSRRQFEQALERRRRRVGVVVAPPKRRLPVHCRPGLEFDVEVAPGTHQVSATSF